MNDALRRFLLFMLLKYRQPSTWIPVTTAIGAWLHFKVPMSPDAQAALDYAFAAVIGALFVAINERKGSNPENAPLPPPGTAQVVTPISTPDTASVIVPPTPAQIEVKP